MAKRVAGERLASSPRGHLMRQKNNGWFWSEEVEEEFFDHLAATANVRAAAEAVGFCTPTVYRQRRRRPEFAARWQAALEQGYARLEMTLLQAANDSLEGVEFDDERPVPKMTVDQAMNVLRAHRNTIHGDGRRGPGRFARRRSLEEVRESILRKVRAIRAMREEEVDEEGEGVPSLSPPACGRGQGVGSRSPRAVVHEEGGCPPLGPLPQAGGEEEGA